MPTYVWLLIWFVAIAVVAVGYARERRARRPEVTEFDRTQHEAVRQAGMNLDGRGPNGPSQSWWG